MMDYEAAVVMQRSYRASPHTMAETKQAASTGIWLADEWAIEELLPTFHPTFDELPSNCGELIKSGMKIGQKFPSCPLTCQLGYVDARSCWSSNP